MQTLKRGRISRLAHTNVEATVAVAVSSVVTIQTNIFGSPKNTIPDGRHVERTVIIVDLGEVINRQLRELQCLFLRSVGEPGARGLWDVDEGVVVVSLLHNSVPRHDGQVVGEREEGDERAAIKTCIALARRYESREVQPLGARNSLSGSGIGGALQRVKVVLRRGGMTYPTQTGGSCTHAPPGGRGSLIVLTRFFISGQRCVDDERE